MAHDRRRFLRLSGLAAAGVLAGCSGGDGGGEATGTGTGGGGETTEGGAGEATEGLDETTAAGVETETPLTTGGTAPTEAGTAAGTEAAGTGTAGTDTGAATGTGTGTGGGAGGSGGSQAVDSWLSGVDNYDGTIADMTGQGSVSVTVGASGNDGNFAFDPPAVRVSSGTTVTWEWNGQGGAHNVVAQDGSFRSGAPQQGGSVTYERTFDSAGTVTYLCEPHESLGMKGALVVEG